VLKDIEKLAKKFQDVEEVKKELKKIQSIKCRLKKQKSRKNYEQEMTKVIKQEQALKEVRAYFEPKEKFVTEFTLEDIKLLNHDETIKAIKSIQSKKCNTQYLTANKEDNAEYQNAVKIEKMLLEHKQEVKPLEETVVAKSSLNDLINNLENLEQEISKDYLLEQLRKLTQS
jgi:hypothetical protein